MRIKYQNVETMCDLVSIMKAEGKNMEVFMMTVWLIWLQRNKLRTNEVTSHARRSLSQPHPYWPSFSKENRGGL